MPPFVHLRLHSEYSVVDGIVRVDEAIASAVADGMPALALTDLSNVFGLVKFYTEARGKGVKPIAGCDVWIANETDRDKPFRLLLLCQNHAGYLRLCELLTRAFRENRYRGRTCESATSLSARSACSEQAISHWRSLLRAETLRRRSPLDVPWW